MESEISEILPYLFVGQNQDARNAPELSRLGVTHILSVMESARFDQGPQFVLMHVPLSDVGESNLSSVLSACCDFIDNARRTGGKVFLHCGRGQNRSPTIATAYLMHRNGMRLKEAFNHVRNRRPEFAPHEAYLRQLQEIETFLYGSISLKEDDEPLSIQEIIRRIAAEKE